MSETRNEMDGDEVLAARAREGCCASYDVLVDRYAVRVVSFLRGYAGGEEDARDLAQQAFVRAFHRLDRYNPARPFRPWLFTVARRLAADQGRRRRETVSNVESDAVDRCDPAYLLARRETADALWAWIRGQLAAAQFRAFRLRVQEEWSVQEIAEAMHRSPVHVRVLLYRARQRLAGVLHAAARAGEGAPAADAAAEVPALLRAARQRKEWCG